MFVDSVRSGFRCTRLPSAGCRHACVLPPARFKSGGRRMQRALEPSAHRSGPFTRTGLAAGASFRATRARTWPLSGPPLTHFRTAAANGLGLRACLFSCDGHASSRGRFFTSLLVKLCAVGCNVANAHSFASVVVFSLSTRLVLAWQARPAVTSFTCTFPKHKCLQ